MALDVPAVQQALRDEGLDAWLWYDFHGSNPISARLAGTLPGSAAGKMTTRRWFYLIPATGEPQALVHAIEQHNLDGLPGRKTIYAGREQLETGLGRLLKDVRRVAMEYSPSCAIPYVSRVDAGTIELVRSHGAEVQSSGDLVQLFEARWDERALESHRRAAGALYRIKDRTFEAIADRIRRGARMHEYEIQQLMTGWFADEGLISDSPPVVAAQENSGNPHYLPTAAVSRTIDRDELILIDLWGKLPTPGAVYADITWVGFTGPTPTDEMTTAFRTASAARDAAVDLVQQAATSGRTIRGWEVDRAAQDVLRRPGFGAHVLHRTGHSLGTEVHGNGAHMDDFETHDERRLVPGTGFTIEPGLYFDAFGVRTEINVYFGAGVAEITGPVQSALVTLG